MKTSASQSGNKVLVSGIQPSGRPHIGNYFGAIKQFVDLQNSHESYVFIADLHALTSVQSKETLRDAIIDVAIDYLAVGLDPKKVTLYKQSDVPAHAELAWIFECITTMPYLMRAHAFKDAEAKNKEINVGLFNYPMLMAADILLYDPHVVPVGQDQKQHIEIARDTAEKFNHVFGETFRLPEPLIQKEVGVVPGTDGQKMSKSYKNTIPLFATKDEIAKGVMSIPTDSKGVDEPKNPDECKVFALHKLFASESQLAELRRRYEGGLIGYRESKEILVDQIEAFIKPLRKKREAIAKNRKKVIKILAKGGKKARARAEEKMALVRHAVGLTIS